MNIPDPKANFGEKVIVENYRSRYSTPEPGEVVGLEYRCLFGAGFHWSYRVRLDRKSQSGRPIFLTLSGDGIAIRKKP